MFDIKENLKMLPDSPGVYIHKDKLGQVIYVGKAISLKNRVRQYFQSSRNMDAKVRAMVGNIEEFEYITVATEMEALVLECNLIKKYMPKYNVLLRDDKSYPYIKVSTNEEFPRIFKTRRVEKDGAKYFGPYPDATAVNNIVELLNSVFRLKRCSARSFSEDARPCLNYHINQCEGICTGNVSGAEYKTRVSSALEFLNGRQKPLLEYLAEAMSEAANRMDYEGAAGFRDSIAAAKAISETQRVVVAGTKDMDVVLGVRGEKENYAAVFFVRDGKLSGRETYAMQASTEDDTPDIVSAFIKQHYGEATILPKEILLAAEIRDSQLTEQYLSELRGTKVKLIVPKKGEKKALVDLAKKNAVEMTKTIDEKERNRRERALALGNEMHEVIAAVTGKELNPYAGRQYRIEAYDISNTNGVDTVGAMVVFEGLKPVKKDYRRFKVRTIEGPNDYGSLQEVVFRRIKRYQEGDPSFSKLPAIMLIDGGKAQVSVVMQVLAALKVDVPVAGMAKDDHHRTKTLVFQRPGEENVVEWPLAEKPLLFKYIGTIQEEVHRFAIEYHRGLRGKRVVGSALDEIEGVGPNRRNALLSHFGSMEKIKEASLEDLCNVNGITKRVAEKILEYFN